MVPGATLQTLGAQERLLWVCLGSPEMLSFSSLMFLRADRNNWSHNRLAATKLMDTEAQ